MKTNLSNPAPCNGVRMCGETGTTGTGVENMDWITLPDASIVTMQCMLKGTNGTHITVVLQACVRGGEASPTTIATKDPTSLDMFATVNGAAYDRYRVRVSAQTVAGAGSQVYLSARR